jgi:hypothetical protein
MLKPTATPDGNYTLVPEARPLADWIKDAPPLPTLGGSLHPATP